MKKLVFGATGLLGSAFMRKYPDALGFSTKDLDCADIESVLNWFKKNQKLFLEPVEVYLCMGVVSGINGQENLLMMFENLYMSLNMLSLLNVYTENGSRVIYFSSSCVYPKGLTNLKPSDLLTGALEPSNEGYALAKIIATKYIEYINDPRFYCIVPPNLCGPNDNWTNYSHVLQAMIMKLYTAKKTKETKVTFWGSSSICREYLYVDDLVDGVDNFIKHTYIDTSSPRIVHIGYDADFTLSSLANMVANRLSYEGSIEFDGTNPGNPRKLLDSSYMKYTLKWKPKYSIFGIIDKLVKDYEEWKKPQKNI